ncbi:uncharacterized protein LOC113234941 [Hyposmocoma kahamanoa]|uniref:uncharacterized protein LOC113234941 n=1 Tax=Hyposmocoma kahamanoa TaxID=1477025 RepID=UPI000E6D5D89|nr:uncharacterized protein LOC113234941 [Hyposmocoma kahamanoa]
MNELLQQHGCSNVFTVPEGLRELMSDISREVLRAQPTRIYDFIANYLSVLLITREHGILAVRILDDLCDCKPSVSEHLIQIGFNQPEAEQLAQIIKQEIEGDEPTEGTEKVKELEILKRILSTNPLDEDMTAKVCQITRNAYRDYWYKKKLLEQSLKVQADEPWEVAAQHTLEIYKKTKPSFTELTRATEKIQAAYRGYYIRKNMIRHLKLEEKKKKQSPKVELLGAPLDIAGSREIELGHVIDIKEQVHEDDVDNLFGEVIKDDLGLKYDPQKTIAHTPDISSSFDRKESLNDDSWMARQERGQSRMVPATVIEFPGAKDYSDSVEAEQEYYKATSESTYDTAKEVPEEIEADDAVSVAKSVETEGDADTAFTSDVENTEYVDTEDNEVEESVQ